MTERNDETVETESEDVLAQGRGIVSIETLETTLGYLKQEKKPSKAIKKRIVELNRKIRGLQEQYKAAAMELEKTNLDSLIFIDSTNGFKKLAGNSALIYANDIARRIGRRVNLRVDSDRYSRSEVGIVAIKMTDDLVQKLQSAQILKNEKQPHPGLTIFSLKAAYKESEIEEIKNSSKKISEKINKIVVPKNPIPIIYSDLRELNVIIFQNCQNMPPFGREKLGNELYDYCSKMYTIYCRLANSSENVEGKILQILKGAQEIKYTMKKIEDLHLMSAKTILRILELSNNIAEVAKREYSIRRLTAEQQVEHKKK